MKKCQQATAFALLLLFCQWLPCFSYGQQFNARPFPSDSSLLNLVKRHVHSPIKKKVDDNGDVFLQRDMTTYLRSTVQAPEVPAHQLDKGHDHKDDMLRTFLNRPHPDVATMNIYFKAAAKEFGVPVSILKATAQVQSNWAQVSESMYGSWGVMGIIENKHVQQVSLAANLLNTSTDNIKNNANENIRAAAALLAHYQKGRASSNNEFDWFDAVKDLTGLTDAEMKHELAVRIYDVMKTGSKTVTLWGEIILMPPLGVELPGEKVFEAKKSPVVKRANGTDYTSAIENYTTCNFNTRPAGNSINYYFVHYVATGTYQGAISWFKDCASSVSAHYVIRNNDGQVSQVVPEASRAWSQGVTSYNDQGIGVEHEVLATNLGMWDNEAMLASAASLCADVCTRRGIPRQRRVINGDKGIYGHSDVKPTDCPNLTTARWNAFLSRVSNASANVAAPVLYSVANPGSSNIVDVTWKANTEPMLAGYRLYYAKTDSLNSWALAANETTLTAATTSISLNPASFVVPPAGDVYHFKLTAVLNDGVYPLVESAAGDIYSRSSNIAGSKVLIVDGFDRTAGSYTAAAHPFAASYFKALRNKGNLQISSVANERVEDGTFSLNDYDIVVWFVGDESSANVVFSASEKAAISSFLTNGGKLLVSGSEIAYNIGRSGAGAYDLTFMNNFLKSTYVADGSISYTPATGIAGTPFEGLTIPFGIVYVEDFPDAINAVTGATNIFNYSDATKKGGVAYKGPFGGGTNPGALIFLSFTLETAIDRDITTFMHKALQYFDEPVNHTPPALNDDAGIAATGAAKSIGVLDNDENYGTSFDIATLVIVTPPAHGQVSIGADGKVTYTSEAGFTGVDEFTYRISNTSGQASNVAKVYVTVRAIAACDGNAPEGDDAHPKRELRGAWVSTVSNIDWPSSRTLTTAQQQAELIAVLDTLARTGINSVYLQVRPESDALYASTIEPWSYWLTGAQGTAPNPLWDPLTFAIAQAHARGMELHAWINPYRAKQSTPVLAANHVATLHPEWTFASGTITMLNPGMPEVRNYVTNVIADIANRYEVDGIHFDDYFYPYAGMTGQDNATYTNNNPKGIATIEDWRRDNVNQLVAMVYDTLSAINQAGNRNVLFGVSPFGIWKSGVPAGISGTSSYSQLYCDPIAWLQAGKVDYLAPQLYWKITGAQDYRSLSKWWNDQGVTYNRPIYPGLAIYRLSDASNWLASDIESQVDINRSLTHENTKGQIMFSAKHLVSNSKGLKLSLQNNQFKYKSFSTPMAHKDAVCPNAPANVRQVADTLYWEAPAVAGDGDAARKYVVYQFNSPSQALTHQGDGKKVLAIVYGNKIGLPVDGLNNSYFMVTALDKNNNESDGIVASVLPVTGLQFTVKLTANQSQLAWKTLTETHTNVFEIERSTDGRNFAYVASIKAAGNSSIERKYAYADWLLSAGTYHYRLKKIDVDGKATYSETRSVTYLPAANQVVVAPNPFSNFITISNLKQAKAIELIDMTGRIIMVKQIANETMIRLSTGQLAPGTYTVRIIHSNSKASSVKVVKL